MDIKIKESFSIYFFLILSFLYLTLGSIFNVPIIMLLTFFTLIGIILDGFFKKNKIRVKKKECLYLCLFLVYLMVECLFFNKDILLKIYFLQYIYLFLVLKNIEINKINIPIIIGIFIVIIIQLFLNGRHYGRFYLNVGDPNFSALLFYLLILYLNIYTNKMTILLFGMGLFLFKSRSYFLAVLIFYSFDFFKQKIYKWIQIFRINSLLKINIYIFIFTVFTTNLYLSNNYFNYKTSIRILKLKDASNNERFNNNLKAINILKKMNKVSFLGYNSKWEENFIEKGTQIKLRVGMPHNDLLKLAIITGIVYTLIYYSIISYIFKPYFIKKNYRYIFGYFSYSLFLHTITIGLYFLLFLIIIIIKTNYEKRKNNVNNNYSML